MTIFENAYFKLVLEGINVWIHMLAQGFDIKQFDQVSKELPRLKLTNFGHLSKALTLEQRQPVIIGVYRHKVEIDVASDALSAYATVYLNEAEYAREASELPSALMAAIQGAGLQHGVLKSAFAAPIPRMTKFEVAKGTQPEDGEDAVIRYFQLSDRKPTVQTDGKVNHYELKLIDNIRAGEWLGEKTPSKPGTEGINVYGEAVPAKAGRDFPLRFDPKTVDCETQEDGTERLIARKDGAVRIADGRIGVDNHLVINGDVNYATGNIQFDGYVTITGTVQDGFSVVALNDITIQGAMGVGAVAEIKSQRGSIFVKGGINGKNVAKIYAGAHVYLKYANECTVEAGNSINIGFYAMDAQLKAKKIIVNPEQGRVIGGRIEAEHQIVAGTLGNRSERRTDVRVQGFERVNVKDELDALAVQYKEMLSRTNKVKRQLEVFETHLQQLDDKAINTYKGMKVSYDNAMDEVMRMQNRIELLTEILKTRGEGEVQITQSAFPKTFLEIKTHQKQIMDTVSGSFYVKDNTLYEIR